MTYGYYNPYYPLPIQQLPTQTQQTAPQQTQQSTPSVFPTVYVSSIKEVEGIRPDQNNNPMYFHNRGNKEIYLKQYDSAGLAPIQTFRLVEEAQEQDSKEDENYNKLSEKVDMILSLLTSENIETKERKKKNEG